MENKILELKKLERTDYMFIYNLLSSADSEYAEFFHPFEAKPDVVRSVLENAVKDMFFGMFVSSEPAGFYMLRGLDQGYKIPSYGVFIAQEYCSLGLAKLSLLHADSVCKLNGIETLMLKVHPKNLIAKKIYEANGFLETGFDEKNGNIVYHKQISGRKS